MYIYVYISLHMYPFELVIFLWIPCFFSRLFFCLAVSGGGQSTSTLSNGSVKTGLLSTPPLPPLLLPTPLLLLLLTTVSTTTIFGDS